MGQALTSASQLMCPHGGTITASPSQGSARAGAAILVQTDTFSVSGCPFTLPNGKPSPCLTVQWIVADRSCTAGGTPTLSTASVGLCLSDLQVPQGAPIVAQTQSATATS